MARWPQPTVNAQVNSHALATGLVRCVLANEGTGSPKELIGSATGTLKNGATWGTHPDIGTTLDLSAGTTSVVEYANNGLSYGNGNFSVFFLCVAPAVQVTWRYGGATGGSTSETLGWTLNDNKWALVLRTVIEIVSAITVTGGRTYAVGMSYTRGTSCRFSSYDQTTGTVTRETVNQTLTPAAVNAAATIGNSDVQNEGWGGTLGMAAIWNRALSDSDFDTLNANPYVFLNEIQLRPNADVSAGNWTSTGASLNAVIDDATVDDLDYIQSGATPTNDVSEVALSDPTTIAAGGAVIRVRVRK